MGSTCISTDTRASTYFIMNSNLLVCLLVLGVATTAWSWPNAAAKRFLQHHHKRAGCDMKAAEVCGAPAPGAPPPQTMDAICALLKEGYKCAVDHGCEDHPEIQMMKAQAGPELGCVL